MENRSQHKSENQNEARALTKGVKKKTFGFYFGFTLLTVLVLGVATLIYLAVNSPEDEVLPGKQINQKYLKFIKEQELLGKDEVIQFWYSDSFGDFKKGFYFITNEKVVLYSKNWHEPALLIPYSEIADVEFEGNASRWENSYITLYLTDDAVVFIPVSNTNKGDEKFHRRLVSIWNEQY